MHSAGLTGRRNFESRSRSVCTAVVAMAWETRPRRGPSAPPQFLDVCHPPTAGTLTGGARACGGGCLRAHAVSALLLVPVNLPLLLLPPMLTSPQPPPTSVTQRSAICRSVLRQIRNPCSRHSVRCGKSLSISCAAHTHLAQHTNAKQAIMSRPCPQLLSF